MGGGGFDIHYGIFRKPTDTVYESSKATNERLLTCLDWTFPVTKDSYVLDLGSGHGGISHEVRRDPFVVVVVGFVVFHFVSSGMILLYLLLRNVVFCCHTVHIYLMLQSNPSPQKWSQKIILF